MRLKNFLVTFYTVKFTKVSKLQRGIQVFRLRGTQYTHKKTDTNNGNNQKKKDYISNLKFELKLVFNDKNVFNKYVLRIYYFLFLILLQYIIIQTIPLD